MTRFGYFGQLAQLVPGEAMSAPGLALLDGVAARRRAELLADLIGDAG